MTKNDEWLYHYPQYDGDIPEYIRDPSSNYVPDEWEFEYSSWPDDDVWNSVKWPSWRADTEYRFRHAKTGEASTALSSQEGGSHYTGGSIQPIEYIHANKLDFFEGNVVKYVTRHKSKGGAEDIRKAIHYLEMLLELNYKEG